MKVKDLLKKVEDPKIYIEFIDSKGFASYGFYTRNELKYNDRFSNDNIKSINIQYIKNKRVIILYI